MIAGVPGNASGALTGPFKHHRLLVMSRARLAGRRRSPRLVGRVLFQLIKIYPPFNTDLFIRYQA